MTKESLTPTELIISSIDSSKVGKIIKLFWEGTPYLNTMYTGIVGRIEKKNLIIFMQEWCEKCLDEKIDENNKQQTELIAHAVLKSIRCSHDEQIHRIINVLINRFNGYIESYDDAEDIINIISEMSVNEAVVLKTIYDIILEKQNAQEKCKKTVGISVVATDVYADISRISAKTGRLGSKIDFYMGRLLGKGLIREKRDETWGGVGSDAKWYVSTEVGKMLIDFAYKHVDN